VTKSASSGLMLDGGIGPNQRVDECWGRTDVRESDLRECK